MDSRCPTSAGHLYGLDGGMESAGVRLKSDTERDQENAPSRSRLRPTHPIDLRRSDCRAGEPSTSGAPCSVHSETYCPIWPASSTRSRQCVAKCDNRVSLGIRSRNSVHAKHTEAVAPSSDLPTDRRRSDCLSEGHQPRALRPRCNRDTTARFMRRQVGTDRKSAVCEFFFTSSTILRLDACALTKRDQGFAEPGALSSTSPADLPLPRTASREGFVLVASRARRSGNLRLTRGPRKGICRRKPRNLRTRGVR